MATPKKIAIIGGSLWGNRGAAAMLETTIARVRSMAPDTQFCIFSPHPIKDQLLSKDPQLEFFDSKPMAVVSDFLRVVWYRFLGWFGVKVTLNASMKGLSESDALLDIGGITFSDGRLIFLPYNILTIWPALMLKVPVIKMSQAAGSFNNPIIRYYAKKFLPRCAKIFARGEKTLQYLHELGLPDEKVKPATDVAFLYSKEYCLTSENRTAIKQVVDRMSRLRSEGTSVVAVSPSVLVLEKSGSSKVDYNQVLLDLINGVGSKEVHFVFFPNASREKSKKSRNNDIIAIERLRAQAELTLPRPLLKKISWITYDVDTSGIEDIVKNSDVLVASRFHAMVFGLRLCVPTLVIGWGHKYMEAMQAFQQEKFVFDYRDSQRDLSQVLIEMLEANTEIRSVMKKAHPSVTRSSEGQFDYLKEFLHEV